MWDITCIFSIKNDNAFEIRHQAHHPKLQLYFLQRRQHPLNWTEWEISSSNELVTHDSFGIDHLKYQVLLFLLTGFQKGSFNVEFLWLIQQFFVSSCANVLCTVIQPAASAWKNDVAKIAVYTAFSLVSFLQTGIHFRIPWSKHNSFSIFLFCRSWTLLKFRASFRHILTTCCLKKNVYVH